MRRWKWLSFICPWFNVNQNPDCETCDFYYVITPGIKELCLWGHEISIIPKGGNQKKTPFSGTCRDYTNSNNCEEA